MSVVLDLDIFKPEEKSIKLGNKEFDITEIPYEFSLMVYESMPILKKLEAGEILSPEEYERFFNIIYGIFHNCDETVDRKWLKNKITWERFGQLMPVLYSAIFSSSKKNETENAEDSQKST